MTETITSAANPLIKRLRRLADRKHRRREGAFVVEGVQPVWSAVDAGAGIDTLVVAPDLVNADVAERLVEREQAAGTPVARVGTALFRRLSDRDDPSGLAAVVRARSRGLSDLLVEVDASPAPVFLALHNIGNPGNLGTIIRTADATGAAGVVLIGDTTDPYAPAAVKASMGSLFATDLAECRDVDEFFSWASDRRVSVVATSGYSDTEHWDLTCPGPTAVLLGAEGPGLPPAVLQRSDHTVRIPMTGTAESLNLSVAAGVLLYELRRHALRGTGPKPPIGSG